MKTIKSIIYGILILIIVIIAFEVRYRGISFDLPDITYADESVSLYPAIKMIHSGDLIIKGREDLDLVYGPFYIFMVVYVGYFFSFIVSCLGYFESSSIPDWFYYYLGRGLNAILGTTAILVMMHLGKRFFSRSVGLIAGLFLAFNLTHVYTSIYAKPDALMSLIVVLSLYASLCYLESQTTKNILWMGLFCGLSFSARFSSLPLVIPLGLATSLGIYKKIISEHQKIIKFFIHPHWLILIGTVLGGYVLGNPNILVRFPDFLHQITGRFWSRNIGHTINAEMMGDMSRIIDLISNAWKLNIQAVAEQKQILFWISLAGIIMALIKHRRRDLVLISLIPSVFIIVMPKASWTQAKHLFLATLPIFAIYFSYCLTSALGYLNDGFRSLVKTSWCRQGFLMLTRIGLILFLINILGQYKQGTYGYVNYLTGKSSQYEDAREWMLKNLPIGSKIAYFLLDGPVISSKLYDLDTNVSDHPFDYFNQRYDYLIINDRLKDSNNYKLLANDLISIRSLKVLQPSSMFNHGIEIYQLKGGDSQDLVSINQVYSKPGDYAGIHMAFKGESGENYTIYARVYDPYPLTEYPDYIEQEMIINDRVVWKNDMGGDNAYGWIPVVKTWSARKGINDVIIQVRGGTRYTSGWARKCQTKIEMRIVNSQNMPVDSQKKFIHQNGYLVAFRNFYTETLPNKTNGAYQTRPRLWEENNLDDWGIRSYVRKNKGAASVYGLWMEAGDSNKYGQVNLSERYAKWGEETFQLSVSGNLGVYSSGLHMGQTMIVNGGEIDKLPPIKLNWLIDQAETQSKDFHLSLRVIAHGLGGKIINERNYTIYEYLRDNKESIFDVWQNYQLNLKDDFTFMFMRWKSVKFLTIILEIENRNADPVGLYINCMEV